MAAVPTIEAVEQVTLPPIRPGVGWYVAGAAVVVAGLVAGFFLLTAGAFGYLGEIDELARVEVPGEDGIELPEGSVVVFHEPDGGPVGSPAVLGLVVRDPGGQAVTLEAPDAGDRYTVDDRRGVGIAHFTASTAGRYETSTSSGTGALAIGPSPRRHLTRFGLTAVVTAAVALLVGIALIVVTRRRRQRALVARTEMQQSGRPVERLA